MTMQQSITRDKSRATSAAERAATLHDWNAAEWRNANRSSAKRAMRRRTRHQWRLEIVGQDD